MNRALSIRNAVIALAGFVALHSPALADAHSTKTQPPGSTNLTLINGWKNSPFGTAKASASLIHGIVHLKGAISTTGTNHEPFVMPVTMRPPANAYVKVDMCGSTNGRLLVTAAGDVIVQARSDFGNAQCFTSLDGVSFAVSSDGFKSLTMKHGWTGATGTGTSIPAAKVVDGIVHLQGFMSTSGSSAVPFVLPAKFRPLAKVYVPVDMCSASNGRVVIETDGTTTVQAEEGFSFAQCGTSLEGATFPVAGGFTALSLTNGWVRYSDTSSAPGIRMISGVVHFQGAMSDGNSGFAFTLPVGFRPAKPVYVPVDLCFGKNGRFFIDVNGNVTVFAEHDFTDAQCFTSLEGVSFRP